MTSPRIIDSSKRPRKIVDSSARPASVSAQQVVQAMGARPKPITMGEDTSHLALYQVRHVLQSMLASTGGRPALTGAHERIKIPRIEADWQQIERITASVADGISLRPSSGQMAAVLLHMAVQQFSAQQVRAAYQAEIAATA